MDLQALQRFSFFRSRQVANATVPVVSGVDHRAAVAAFQDAGFWILREGVHIVMTNGRRILTIPCADPVLALTMEGIVRDAGLSLEKFRQLL
jgi:hypothetical protein